ncbi:UvrD-helicase domain-containing protein [Buchnera aphidicola (Mollitrichosiphum nigrofasciatum)]|uniref:UvrD-helicase domain-containing protein n=1 Tax=Buchnera aphidicola TaxID=9 RepID=UPI0031B805EE
MKYKKNINIFAKKIYGNVFIEASAGTGKTFTIIMLYLRFLLGINLKKKYNKPFSIKQILIVTFTKTACLELKKRIRENISELKKTIINKKKTKFTFFLKHITNIKQSIYLLQKAEEKIDNIEIYTIHGFCKKILENYSYKYPSKNNKLIIKDSKKIYLKATNQFWEKYYSTLPINLLTIILKYWKNPYELFKIIYPIIQIKKTIKKKTKKKRNIITQHLKIIEKIKNFKKKWIKIYSKIKKKKKKNIIIFKSIKKINNWAYCITKNYDIPKELSILKKKIKNNKKKIFKKFNKKIIIFINKVYIEKIKTEQYLIKHALNIIPKIVKKKKKKYIEYEDLINEIYKKVYKKQKFVQHIQKKYPIGFIDEFQDTDRKQYKIFNKIYKNQKTYLLLLIGDPKQAIYNFRGANIKTYFKQEKKHKKFTHSIPIGDLLQI